MFPCSAQMRIYSNLTVIRSMGTIKIITWYAFNNATWESVLVRILQYFYCVLITMPVTTSNYHSWLSNLVGPSGNDHSKHGNIVFESWRNQSTYLYALCFATSPRANFFHLIRSIFIPKWRITKRATKR